MLLTYNFIVGKLQYCSVCASSVLEVEPLRKWQQKKERNEENEEHTRMATVFEKEYYSCLISYIYGRLYLWCIGS